MILITGATGFLGSELAVYLAKQETTICCIKRKTSVIPNILFPYQNKIRWIDADLLNYGELENAFKDITQVYHCGAWVSFKEADRASVIDNNVQGTANVVELCKQQGVRMVHVSSVAAVGLAKQGELITEDHQFNQNTRHDGYATSKFESEAEVWRGINDGLNAVIVNPSIIIGTNAGKKGSGEIFETLRKGMLFYTTGGNGFVDAEDVVKCMVLLMSSGITGQRYIINNENISYKNLSSKITKAFKKPSPKILLMPWALELAWRGAAVWSIVTGKSPAIDKTTARSVSSSYYYDTSKIRKAIPIEFKPLDQSIIEICERLLRS